jgi:hypothetical protein
MRCSASAARPGPRRRHAKATAHSRAHSRHWSRPQGTHRPQPNVRRKTSGPTRSTATRAVLSAAEHVVRRNGSHRAQQTTRKRRRVRACVHALVWSSAQLSSAQLSSAQLSSAQLSSAQLSSAQRAAGRTLLRPRGHSGRLRAAAWRESTSAAERPAAYGRYAHAHLSRRRRCVLAVDACESWRVWCVAVRPVSKERTHACPTRAPAGWYACAEGACVRACARPSRGDASELGAAFLIARQLRRRFIEDRYRHDATEVERRILHGLRAETFAAARGMQHRSTRAALYRPVPRSHPVRHDTDRPRCTSTR